MQIENSTFEYYMNDLRELFDDPTLTNFTQIPTCVRYLKDQLEAAQKDAARWAHARDNFDMQSDEYLWIYTDNGHRINVQAWSRCENERACDAAMASKS